MLMKLKETETEKWERTKRDEKTSCIIPLERVSEVDLSSPSKLILASSLAHVFSGGTYMLALVLMHMVSPPFPRHVR